MKNVIAIDLGGTNLRVGIVDENLNVIKVIREKSTHGDEEALYEQMVRMIKEVTKDYTGEKIDAIGISAAGFCENGVLKCSPNLQIGAIDIAGNLRKDFPDMKVGLANDANCAALMEAKFGAAAGCSTSFFITISSGIGCGLVHEGKLVDLPFECGHYYIGYNKRFYEFEQLCSGNGIVNLAQIDGLEVKNAQEFFALVSTKDKKARKVYDMWLQLVGSFLSNTQVCYNPDVIILSGGVMKSSNIFFNDLLSVTNAFVAPFPVKKACFKLAKFDQDTGLMGGAAIALSL